MESLKDWIINVRREMEAGLAVDTGIEARHHLEAEKVTLSIELAAGLGIARNGTTAAAHGIFVAPNGSATGNRLTIEFRLARPGENSEPISGTSDIGIEKVSEADKRERIRAAAAQAFGQPGFDNSARAEVFCEWMASLSTSEVRDALGWLESHPEGAPPDSLQRPLGRLRQLLGFSPVGHQKAAALLRRLIDQIPIVEVTAVIAAEWRFGTHWPLASQPTDG